MEHIKMFSGINLFFKNNDRQTCDKKTPFWYLELFFLNKQSL